MTDAQELRKSIPRTSAARDWLGVKPAGEAEEHKFSARPQPEPYEIPSVRLPTSPAPQSGGYGVNKRNVPPAIPYVLGQTSAGRVLYSLQIML